MSTLHNKVFSNRSNALRAIKRLDSPEAFEITRTGNGVEVVVTNKVAAPKAAPETAPVKRTRKPRVEGATVERVKRNGVLQPRDGSSAGRVWALCDEVRGSLKCEVPAVKAVREAADETFNANQISIEFYQWKKFNGFNKKAGA